MSTSLKTVQGATRLAFDSVEGITNAVERMHETIARHPLPWSPQPDKTGQAHGLIASSVYSTIKGVSGALRDVVDQSFELLPSTTAAPCPSTAEIKTTAALNGAFGDHLETTGNALATKMKLMAAGQPLTLKREALENSLEQVSPHLVVLVHGLSLSELCWDEAEGAGIGNRLQSEKNCTALYLRYNSGRHISTNGQDFEKMLEQLCQEWPVPVETISLIGHSMGGLVIRSGCWYAQRNNSDWLSQLRRVVCLGTPHHGSSVAKAGHALSQLMRKIPYTEPLDFGRHRSAGIKDLRHGNLLDQDWQGHEHDQSRPNTSSVVPLLPNVDYYFAAATLGRDKHDPLGIILGDLLVRLDSAVGFHSDDLKKLNIKPENCRVFNEKNHFDLLRDDLVHRQVIDWFTG